MLVAKKCSKCNAAMHIHSQGPRSYSKIIFAGCEPCLIKLRIKKISDGEVKLLGRRSTKRIRCCKCMKINLIAAFEEVNDGIQHGKSQEDIR